MRDIEPPAAVIVGLLLLSACAAPAGSSETQTPQTDTASAATAEALLTGLAPTSIPATPSPVASPTEASPLPPAPTATPLPISTSPVVYTQPVCDMAGFVEDVTIPDGTDVEPGSTFTKTWRLSNEGTCTWNADYRVVFFDGDALGGPDSAEFTSEDIAPGETVDVSVDLQSPDDAGSYTGYWKLENSDGEMFGIGATGSAFWVKINVPQAAASATPTRTLTAAPAATSTATTAPTETPPTATDTPTEEILPTASASPEA